MTLEELVAKYVENSKRVFNTIKVNQGSVSLSEEKIRGVIQSAKRYLEDATKRNSGMFCLQHPPLFSYLVGDWIRFGLK
jgi:hypothetical protein